MPIFRVPTAGATGVVQDLSQTELPPQGFTDALNMRFLDGQATQFLGHGEIYPTAPVTPYHLLPVQVGGYRYWLYAGLAKIYAVAAPGGTVTHTNLTRQTAGVDVNYSGAAGAWTSCSLSGIPILNPGNTSDPPQAWDLNLAHKFAALSAWPASTYCKSLRAYKNQLVALNVTKGATNYPFMVKWSHPADPGSVPISWDPTDPTVDAGEVDLAEGGDPIQDGLQLGGTFIVYKQSSVWRMDYTGGAFINSFTKVLGTSGAMNVNCVVEIDGFHVVLTNSDIIVHDGQSAQSVLDKQMRRALFQKIDVSGFGLCFVAKNPFLNEVWICFPSGGATTCDTALVWNYKDKTTTFRQLPNLNYAAFGQVETALAGLWSGDGAGWSSDTTSWAGADFTPDAVRMMMATSGGKLFLADSSAAFDTTTVTSYLERRSVPVGAPEQMKTILSVRPRITGATGDTLTVKVGGSNDDPYSAPTYDATASFTIGQQTSVDLTSTWRYPAIRFENNGGASRWRLDSYDVHWADGGAW
jgi:hypothetical protein